MTDNTTKLRVKIGAAEIEFEGNSEFLKNEVMPTIGKMLHIVERKTDLPDSPKLLPSNTKPSDTEIITHDSELSQLTTSTIAGMINAGSATDLALAASARLILFGSQDPITRQQILDEMKSATAYFKKTFINNHSNTLKTLVKADRLRLVADDAYTLSPKERKEIEAKISKAAQDDA